MADQDKILGNASKLKGKPYKIVTDLPRKMKDVRYRLAREAYKTCKMKVMIQGYG